MKSIYEHDVQRRIKYLDFSKHRRDLTAAANAVHVQSSRQ